MANYENVENLKKLTEEGGAVPALQKKVSASERELSAILRKLSEIESVIQERKTRAAAEEARAQTQNGEPATEKPDTKIAEGPSEEKKESRPIRDVPVPEKATAQEAVQQPSPFTERKDQAEGASALKEGTKPAESMKEPVDKEKKPEEQVPAPKSKEQREADGNEVGDAAPATSTDKAMAKPAEKTGRKLAEAVYTAKPRDERPERGDASEEREQNGGPAQRMPRQPRAQGDKGQGQDRQGQSYGQRSQDGQSQGYGQRSQDGQSQGYGQRSQDRQGQSYSQRSQDRQGQSYGQRSQDRQGQSYGQRSQDRQGQSYGQRSQDRQGQGYGQRSQDRQGQGYGQRNQDGQSQGYGQRSQDRQGQGQGYGQRGQDRQGQGYTAASGDRRRYDENRQSGNGRTAGGASRPSAGGALRTGTSGTASRPYVKPGTRPPVVAPAAPAGSAKQKKDFAPQKKKTFEKSYVEKKPINKRAMSRQEGLSIDDFDEDKTGYRKARFAKKEKKKEVATIRIEHAVVTTQEIPLKVLSEKLGVTAVEITKRLFKEGIMKTVNESIDYDTAAVLAAEMGIDLEYRPAKTAEEELIEMHGDGAADENSVPRAPVVTVMGHVDHGKTSLLDKIRSTSVTAEEAGGITQSIGAYTVSVGGKQITFIDTPGHAAFTAMRARGAKVTDIVILVVAADDGIMPQTVEAINHAKAADVPIIVAVNKIDKPNIDVDRVKTGLMQYDLVPEEWGGDTILVPVSAKTGEGIEELLETINLVAEMQDLRANPEKEGRGSVIEAKLDKGKGPVASVIVQNGTLHTGDNIISGMTMGRIRAMFNDKGMLVKEAGPSMAVSVLGLDDVPNAGDSIFAVDQDLMKHLQEERKNKQREEMVKQQTRVSLDDMFAQVEEGKLKTLNIIIKADVQGSVEAIRSSLEKLTNDEVRVKIIHGAAGAITESDVMLADSANAIIIGFNVRPDTKAKALAEKSKVDVRLYRIIYELLDDMEAAMKGMLAPKYQEIFMGKCDVKQTFNITGVGTVAGCFVTEGKIVHGGKLRIYRENVMIVEGNVKQLKHFKDDVKEVAAGIECGCAIEGFNEIQIGDVIECYIIEEVKRA